MEIKFKGFIVETFTETLVEYNGEKSKKMEFLLEYERGNFPKCVVIEVWNDKIDKDLIRLNNEVEVEAIAKARKSGGRYFNNLTLRKLNLIKKAEPISDSSETNDDEPLPF
ncbi:MAG: DUF3127 domain-containing protein [Spirosomaceae bacterium]|jgi:flagellar biosynthesis component FlhA|nr:DUF3127 domain-containing protein [Spirosomataceae bacterium]